MTGQSGESQDLKTKPPIHNLQDNFDIPVNLPRFSPEELVGITHLHKIEDSQQACAKIVKKILNRDAENHQRVKMLISCDNDKIKELMDCNKLCDAVADQHEMEATGEMDVHTFGEVMEHQG